MKRCQRFLSIITLSILVHLYLFFTYSNIFLYDLDIFICFHIVRIFLFFFHNLTHNQIILLTRVTLECFLTKNVFSELSDIIEATASKRMYQILYTYDFF